MRRFTNSLVGVEQGSVLMFSDFENDGIMWTGQGPREQRKEVLFKARFKGIPAVHASIAMFDTDRRTNLRGDLTVTEVTPKGFTLVFKTWGDTRIARIRADWMAIGEVPAEDDWDVV